jgi:DNA-binding FrmR family transcriptional regulator
MKNTSMILNSFKKAKGQLEAVEKMIINSHDTIDTIAQINAVRGALARISVELIKIETEKCINCGNLNDQSIKFKKMVEELLKRL